jgi:hypothetical protein
LNAASITRPTAPTNLSFDEELRRGSIEVGLTIPVVDEALTIVSDAFASVLGPRLRALVAYGSVVVGDLIPGFSDLDLYVVMRESLRLDESIDLQRALPELPMFGYLQPSFHPVGDPRPFLIPEAFVVQVPAFGGVVNRRY